MTCRHVACDAPAVVHRQLCQRHYQNLMRRAKRAWRAETCAVDGCERAVECRGWCNSHYVAWWRDESAVAVPGPAVAPTYDDGLRARVLALRDVDPSAARRLLDAALQKAYRERQKASA